MSWLLSLCVQKPPAAVTDVSSMSGVHVNHRTGTGTSGTRLPHRHQATWHAPGLVTRVWDTLHVRGGGCLDWTGLCSTLFCCVPRWFICCCPAPVWVARSLRRLRPAGRANIKHMAGTSLHPFITRLANTLDQCPPAPLPWCRCGQSLPLYLYSISVNTQHCHYPAACHHHHQPGGQKVD